MHPPSGASFSRRPSMTIFLFTLLFYIIPALIYFIFSFLGIINLDLFMYPGAIIIYSPIAHAHCPLFCSITYMDAAWYLNVTGREEVLLIWNGMCRALYNMLLSGSGLLRKTSRIGARHLCQHTTFKEIRRGWYIKTATVKYCKTVLCDDHTFCNTTVLQLP